MKYPKLFESCVIEVLKNEGGYVNDHDDKGGETNFGISKKSHPKVDVINLTEDEARDIYYNEYYVPNEYLLVPSNEQYSAMVFDCIVNHGSKVTVILIQRALRSVGLTLDDDGCFGHITRSYYKSSTNEYTIFLLETALRCERAGFYRCLVAKNPTMSKFLRGWLVRAYGC